MTRTDNTPERPVTYPQIRTIRGGLFHNLLPENIVRHTNFLPPPPPPVPDPSLRIELCIKAVYQTNAVSPAENCSLRVDKSSAI